MFNIIGSSTCLEDSTSHPFNPLSVFNYKTSEVVYFFFEHGSNGSNG